MYLKQERFVFLPKWSYGDVEIKAGYYDDDRFDRSKRIDVLDMDRIQNARTLVVGAGALGNEVVKCLILSGFRNIMMVDMDDVTTSNLNRCVFFRESDVRNGMKVDIVAKRASELDPDVKIIPKAIRIQELKEWDFDIVLGCLDNISARLHTNAHCVYHNIPYVDGATDGLRGKVQVVLDDVCLQCTTNRTHAKIVDQRFSCTDSQHIFVPRMAAEITTTSVIAAIQVREALKIISGRSDMCIINVFYYDGMTGETQILCAEQDPECPNHG